MALALLDEAGNPVAAGVQVSVYPAGAAQNETTLVASDWTQAGGVCPYIDLSPSIAYIAVFVGRQGPQIVQAFTSSTGETTTVTVAPHRSPSLTTPNYAALQAGGLWPKGPAWWSDDARASGGVGWALSYAFGAIWQFLDSSSQQRLQAARLQSAAGADVDSWAYDFLGRWLPRYTGESDQSFKARIYAALVAPKTTLPAIQNIVTAYFAAIAASTTAQLAFDSSTGQFDAQQGVFDEADSSVVTPTVLVWDRQSRPDLANLYNVNPKNNDGSFVIQLGYTIANSGAWYLDYESLDYNSFLLSVDQWQLSPPDPRLGNLVNFVKAAASKPLYLTTITNP